MDDELIKRVKEAIEDLRDCDGGITETSATIARTALAALKPLDWWGEPGLDRLYVMSNRQVMQMKNKSGCVCCIDEEYGDEILSRCALHKDDRHQAAEEMRERCIDCYDTLSAEGKRPDEIIAAIRKLEI